MKLFRMKSGTSRLTTIYVRAEDPEITSGNTNDEASPRTKKIGSKSSEKEEAIASSCVVSVSVVMVAVVV